jgi:hypothetical protein
LNDQPANPRPWGHPTHHDMIVDSTVTFWVLPVSGLIVDS